MRTSDGTPSDSVSWKRTLLLFLACVVSLAATTWFVLRKTGVAKAFVQRMLAERISTPFAIADADLDLGRGTLRLSRLEIAHPTVKDRPLLRARDIDVSMNTNPLGEVGRVDKIVLRGVRIDDLQVSGPHALRLSDILKPDQHASGQPVPYPTVVIEDASVGIRFADNQPPLQFEDVDLELAPLEAGGSEVVLHGTMTTLLGTRVTVSGQGDLGKQHFRVLAKAESLPLSPAAVKPFSTEIADALTAAELAGHVAMAQMWIESDENGGTLRGGFQVDADQLSFRAPQFPRRVAGSAVVRGQLQDDGSVSLQFNSSDERGSIHLQGSVQRVFTSSPVADLALDLGRLRVDDELLQALAAQPHAAEVVAAFSPGPVGDIDADVRVDIHDRTFEVGVDATLRGMTASFLGFPGGGASVSFPYPLHDVRGNLHVRKGVLQLADLQAADAHGGTVALAGSIPIAGDASTGKISVRGTHILFHPDLRAALQAIVPENARHYDDCAPEGRADVEVEVTGISANARSDVRVHIEPSAAAVTHAIFPYRCEDVTGSVDIDSDGVVFDLHGTRAGKAVAARGRFVRPPPTLQDAELASELWLRADELVIDDDLRRALTTLSPTTADLWPTLTPSGNVACEVTTWHAAGDDMTHYDVRIDVRDGRATPRAFPLAVERLRGPIFVHGDGTKARIDVHLLQGSLQQDPGGAPAEVFVTGSVDSAGDSVDIDMTTIARGLHLRRELRDVLDHAGAFPAAAWDALHPTGAVDVIARHRAAAGDSAARNHVRLLLDHVGVDTSWLPAPVTDLGGEIVAVDGRASAAELRGQLEGAAIVVRDGEVWHTDGASRVRATISADDFPLNDDLARLFGTSPLRGAYLARKVRGRANVTALDVDCTVPDDMTGGVTGGVTAGFHLRASGQMALRDCSFSLAVPIEHVDGVLTVRECTVDADAGRVAGSLANVSMQVLGRPLHDLSANFTADADEIVLDDLSVRLHGGRVVGEPGAPHLRYRTEGAGTLAANLSWQGIRLSELASGGGRTSGGVSGNLSGKLSLVSLPGTRLIDTVASGEVHITGGRLGDVPLFRTIYAILRRQPQFTSADVDFRIGERRIDIDKLMLGSQILNVRGKGQVSMDGYVDMTIELPDLFGDAADFLILPEIVHSAVAQVLEFKLHGYLRSPEVTPLTPFQGAPRRREIGPIPAPLPDLPHRRF